MFSDPGVTNTATTRPPPTPAPDSICFWGKDGRLEGWEHSFSFLKLREGK